LTAARDTAAMGFCRTGSAGGAPSGGAGTRHRNRPGSRLGPAEIP
jgi:hypothetical protein